MASTRPTPSLISVQDELVGRLVRIEQSGVGAHKRRSRGAAIRDAIERIRKLGFTEEASRAAAHDARDMAQLQCVCEGDDD